MIMLAYENLDVYQVAIQLVGRSERIAKRLPRGLAHLRNQLRRAATSVPLNIAEGSGKRTKKAGSHFYGVARGSAMECGAIADVLEELDAVEADQHREFKTLVRRTVQMLSKMCL